MIAVAATLDGRIWVPSGVYPVDFSKTLERTESDFYDTVVIAARMGRTLPTDHEEQQIYLQKGGGAQRLRDVEELGDYFGARRWYAFGWTLTALRFREADLNRNYDIGDEITAEVIETDIMPYLSQIADPKFTRDNWKDIIHEVNHVRGELAVPYARGQVVREVHPTLGVFAKIEKTTEHAAPHALHGWLTKDLSIPKDPISEHYDVAVGRGGGWHLAERCPAVAADCRRWGAGSDGGFRPVVRWWLWVSFV